jgi:hypothetical protein
MLRPMPSVKDTPHLLGQTPDPAPVERVDSATAGHHRTPDRRRFAARSRAVLPPQIPHPI